MVSLQERRSGCCFERECTAESRRDPHRSVYVGPDAQRACSESMQHGLSARRPPAREIAAMGVECRSDDVVDSLAELHECQSAMVGLKDTV